MSSFTPFADGDICTAYTVQQNPRPEEFKMHTHSTAEIFFFMHGKGVYRIEGSEYPLKSGDLLIMRPLEAHYIEIDPSRTYERTVINFKLNMFNSLLLSDELTNPFTQRKSGKLNLYEKSDFKSERYLEYIRNLGGTRKLSRCEAVSNLLPLLNEIRTAFYGRHTEPYSADETVEYRIIRHINKHLAENISLDEICHRYYISKPQLCRVFKKATGTTVWEYITLKRLLCARDMIALGEKPTVVYTKCGFNDYSAFYRAYKAKFGFAPTETAKTITET